MGDSGVIEKLKAQRDRFIAFAFAGADLLLEVGDDDVITYSAGAGEAVYGLSDGDLTDKRLADFVHAKDRKRFEDGLLKLKTTGRLGRSEMQGGARHDQTRRAQLRKATHYGIPPNPSASCGRIDAHSMTPIVGGQDFRIRGKDNA